MSLLDLEVDWQPGCGEVGFKCLKHVLGIGMSWVPLDAGTQTHTAKVLDHELSLVKTLPIRGSGK